jgi:hypothetical protein
MLETEAMGSALASWDALITLLIAYAVVVGVLFVVGRGPFLLRIPDALERITGLPAWAAASIGTSLYGLLVAGEGFYSDVAWHIALGRDEELFTAPHTSIVIGLGLIFVASGIGVLFATLQRVDTALRVGSLRVPWSMIPLALLGGSALLGFPLDELWHQQYGIDVTMWSPTHMLMILGASFSGLASWLILADAKVSPRDSRWARGVHVVAAWLTLMGLNSAQGEFDFGVPQFQQMFHPILVTIAAGFALVAIRTVHGRGWAIGIVLGSLAFKLTPIFGDSGPVETRDGGLFIVSALVVEAAAWLLGTTPRLRFAVVSGVGVATLGLAAEWVWNLGAHQPWRTTLLPDALVLCLLVGVGAAVLGAAFGRAVARAPRGRDLPPAALVLAGAAVLVGLALPMPRGVGDVRADIEVEPVGDGEALVRVTLDPPDAADDARWFQTVSWQGGGLQLAEMEEVEPGRFVADGPVKVDGRAKALVRLHRGGELMAAPVYLPDDPEIGEPEVPAEDRSTAMTGEADFLLRETEEGDPWLSYAIQGLLALVLAAWVGSFVVVGSRVADDDREPAMSGA